MPGTVPPVADERDGLLAFLAQQRDAVRVAAFGLTEEQARATPSASALSVGGLIKHLVSTERGWIDTMLQRPARAGSADEGDYVSGFRLGPDETLAGVLAQYEQVARETAEAVAGVDLDQPVPVPDAPWFPKDVKAWSVRWVLLHLIEETARHAGHADIIRESVDGATHYELMATAEDWPDTPWAPKWKPATG